MNYNQALELAKKCHNGQFRKRSGLPYITHPIAVADKFEDEDYKIVAVLHDTIGYTELTSHDLLNEHGMDINLILSLECLTKRKDEMYLDYILRCKVFDMSRYIKIADLNHNLSDLEPGTLRDKYIMALYILNLPYNTES